ncbi:MAG TPA: HlyD family efflux transporter periplasmic adaptor subunit [Phycisphaerales bacterium]|nr:HlyD family efflux transporter periplasmic adaptor subunit [Phycisphaerales bacterium]
MNDTIQDNSAAPLSESLVRQVSTLISNLAMRCDSKATFYKRASAAIVQAFRSPYGAISVRLGAEVVEDYWHTGSTDPKFWKKPVEDLLSESMKEATPIARQFTSKDARFRISLMSVLLRDITGPLIGVMSLVVRCNDEREAVMQRELLEAFAAQIMLGASRIEIAAQVPEDDKPDASTSKAAAYTSGVELAFALVSNLRTKLGCEQTAIGVAQGHRVKVQAVSGLDEVSDRAEAVRLMRDAMGEALDRGEITTWQEDPTGETKQLKKYRVHKRWQQHLGGACVASIPLDAGNGATMIVSMRRRTDLPFSDEELESIKGLMEPYAPAFGLIDRANRSVLAHCASSVKHTTKELFSPRGWGCKVAALSMLGIMAWVAFGTMTFSANAPATVKPSVVRHMSAPFQGTLLAVFATAGDSVKEGQLLAVFDDQDLQVEREQLLAQLKIAQINEDRAISNQDNVGAELARAEQRLASSRLERVDRQIAMTRVVAPFDGKIVEGDLRDSIGEAMSMGQPMFQIAQAGSWTVEIQMPQRVASYIEPGRVGRFAPNAKPESPINLQVERVQPHAVPIRGKTVFITEAELNESGNWLKPGMEGIARVDFGSKPVWWLATHRIVDYFRTNYWL